MPSLTWRNSFLQSASGASANAPVAGATLGKYERLDLQTLELLREMERG
ncbi:MAG: hypothetical protein Q4E55_04555 [Bacteroidales bacterium]|nr:hypothetical protein [Bacteroidales bacterium]